jgi:hypothetical protein
VALPWHFGIFIFLHRAMAADESWVDSRIAELNLKSYDRSDVEGIKERDEREGLGRPHDDSR